jgi:hypothetical protein
MQELRGNMQYTNIPKNSFYTKTHLVIHFLKVTINRNM